ncbi:uncharacterized protein LOC143239795 isoform X2 [Tachypleus tridentatus]|uniref:uncharacterized protein LOC143239795 isoform X2 n=1 Tax=Tachypleus tridentatus TaxID=6853 RepID=UPI003FCFF1B4
MSKKSVSQSIMSKFSTVKLYLRTLPISTYPSFYCTEQRFLPKPGWTWAQYKCRLQWATRLWQWMFRQQREGTHLNRGEFINDVVKALNLIRHVAVSPSMSGDFALPYLVKHSTDMGGYVAVAPGATSILERQRCGNDSYVGGVWRV